MPVTAGRYMAERIPGARSVEFDTNQHFAMFEYGEACADEILAAMGLGSSLRVGTHELAAVWFSDRRVHRAAPLTPSAVARGSPPPAIGSTCRSASGSMSVTSTTAPTVTSWVWQCTQLSGSRLPLTRARSS